MKEVIGFITTVILITLIQILIFIFMSENKRQKRNNCYDNYINSKSIKFKEGLSKLPFEVLWYYNKGLLTECEKEGSINGM